MGRILVHAKKLGAFCLFGGRYLPMAITEHGAIMAASVLNSDRAVEMSVYVVRAFVYDAYLNILNEGGEAL